MFNAVSGGLKRTLADVGDAARQLAIDAAGNQVAVTTDTNLTIWRLAGGEPIAQFDVSDGATAIGFTHQGGRIAVAANDGSVRSYAIAETALVEIFRGHTDQVVGLLAPTDSPRLVTASRDGSARIWTAAVGASTTAHAGGAIGVRFVGDGSQLATVGVDGAVTQWETETLTTVATFAPPANAPIQTAIARDAPLAALVSEAGLLVQPLGQSAEATTIPHESSLIDVAVSPSSALVHVATAGGQIMSRRIDDQQIVRTLTTGEAETVRIAATEDGRSVFVLSTNGTVRGWRVADDRPRKNLVGHGSQVYGLAFNGDGSRIATAGADKQVKFWNTADGTNYATGSGHEGLVYAVAFSPDDSQLASCGVDKSVRFWNPVDGKQQSVLTEAIPGGLYTLAYAPSGSQLIAGGLANSFQRWQMGQTQPDLTVEGHPDHVYRLRYNATGTRVASLGYYGNLFIWDAATGEQIHHEQLPVKFAYNLAYSPDGREIAVGSVDHRVLLIDVPESAQ